MNQDDDTTKALDRLADLQTQYQQLLSRYERLEQIVKDCLAHMAVYRRKRRELEQRAKVVLGE